MLSRRPALALALALGLAFGLSLPGTALAPKKPALLQVPVRIRVARCKNKKGKLARAMSEAWIKAHLLAADLVLAPHRVKLVASTETFTPARCELLTRAHRQAMAEHVTMDGKATVLVMPRVRDVDVPTYDLMGVHWRYRGEDDRHRGKRWVFITGRSIPPVLAHELCHFFGLPHDKAGGNLMTPGPSDPVYKQKGNNVKGFSPTLTPAQAKRLRRGVRAFLKSGK